MPKKPIDVRKPRFVDMRVEMIDHMGSDLSVVNAARVSMGKYKFKIDDMDKSLIKYLANHEHWSPFAHTSISFRIKAPIFVARQLAKHQIGFSWNEVSRRYVDSEPEFYIPAMRGRAANVKQGSLDTQVAHAEVYKLKLEQVCNEAVEVYETMLRNHVAPEVARSVLPQNMMTEWVWTGSLYAFFRMIRLRTDSHAQAESREIAWHIAAHISSLFPLSYEALMNARNLPEQVTEETKK